MPLIAPVVSKSLWLAVESTYGTTPAAATAWLRASPDAVPVTAHEMTDQGRTGTGKPYPFASHVRQGFKTGSWSVDGPLTATAAHYLLVGLLQQVPTPIGNVYTYNADYATGVITRAASVGIVGDQGSEWLALTGAVPRSVTFTVERVQGGNRARWSADFFGKNAVRVAPPTTPTIDALDALFSTSLAVSFTTPSLASASVLDFSITIGNNYQPRLAGDPANLNAATKGVLGECEATGEMTLAYGTTGGVAVHEEARDFLATWETFVTTSTGTIAVGSTGNKVTFTPYFHVSGPPSWEVVNNYRVVRFPFRCAGGSAQQALTVAVDNGAATLAWDVLA
jgi:hypothetical protein